MKKTFTLLAAAFLGFSAAQAESVNVSILTYDWDEGAYVTVAKDFSTEITSTDDTFTMADFINSGSPVTFTYGDLDEYGSFIITPSGAYIDDAGEGTYYVLNTSGAYAECPITLENGTKKTIYYPSIDVNGYTYADKFEEADGSTTVSATICMSGFYDKNYTTSTGWLYLSFKFNTATTSISSISVDNNAPIEYFNLQGQRVENPSNGIYITRQGAKVSKVMIR